jgi:hypothetical protein
MCSLLFYKGTKAENPDTTIWDRVICLVTGSRFSHIELSVRSYGTVHDCYSSSTRDNGVRFARIDISSDHWVQVPISKAVDITWLNTKLGQKYDYIGLIGSVLNVNWFYSKRKWFCSELIAAALGLSDPEFYTPEDLFKVTQNGM